MSVADIASMTSRGQKVIVLAGILEHIERSGAPVNEDRYQVVVARLKTALSDELPDDVAGSPQRTPVRG